MSSVLRRLGIGEIPPGEDTPFVRQLIAALELVVGELDKLKKLPETPKRSVTPSPLKDDSGPPSTQRRRKTPKEKRGSKRRSKFQSLPIHEVRTLELKVPEGARRIGYKSFIVQELCFEAVNVKYRRARYRLADGSIVTAPRPAPLRGQFGPNLRCYLLHQHYHCQVTEPLLRQQLADVGISISSGQVNRLLIEGYEEFHREKDQLLPAAREVSKYFQADDTPARHLGKNAHTLHIGNDFFATFFTTDSKSRINFLEILREPYAEYVLNEDTLIYLECFDFPVKLHAKITKLLGAEGKRIWQDKESWEQTLDTWGIKGDKHRQRLTEAALWGCLMHHELYADQPMLTDGAAQFCLLGFCHALCWLHAERHVARLLPTNRKEQRKLNKYRDKIWRYYQRLKQFKETPTNRRRLRLEQDFDKLFQARTGWTTLNEALQKIHAKKTDLLLVLDHPEIPLHNNLSENDIRQFAKMRKISGSTRSESGRRCRDTFLSLKTTCRKLRVSFWRFLQDRINGLHQILPLSEVLVRHAKSKA